jgi:broad specificity phosphatase PhoE
MQHPPRTVVLLRHGESASQRLPWEQRTTDSALVDVALSADGINQAHNIDTTKFPVPDLIVCSPLRRTLMTARLVWERIQQEHSVCVPVIANPDIQEYSATTSCESKGRPVLMLRQEALTILNENMEIDVSLPIERAGGSDRGQWWVDPVEDPHPRLRRFLQWLQNRPENTILVVCHANLMKALLGLHNIAVPSYILNCVPMLCELWDDGRLLLRDELADCARAIQSRFNATLTDRELREVSLLYKSYANDDLLMNEVGFCNLVVGGMFDFQHKKIIMVG